ncbi:MAG TPA: hypothetical protein DCX37_09960 [Firmicutes bacterium]|nr:hypothetical protein [Bacillota bacterium]HBG44720.1 hypothetical protein [Bacillota bacterium]HBL69092.1 hypothetical protein [Bacillota bacterium]HCM17367.1 hypothetical protein [Bacillota bacterium]
MRMRHAKKYTSFTLLWTAVIAVAFLLGALVSAEDQSLVTIENEYIKVFVNNTADGRGRFAVDVTGGDPERDDDDNQPLIYGRPLPWTSYTTINMNGLLFAFGGPVSKRAGEGLATGLMIQKPEVRDGAIVTAWRYGDLEVTQYISIVDGPTTGLPDTARIAYTMVNRGQVYHSVGLRVCIDAMLGENDGAPFRMGEKQILTDYGAQGSTIQSYWQAFDSLEEPKVIAQGTLAGGELTTPDRLFFSNWGTFADQPWNPVLIAGRDFTRVGEFEYDSAVALMWDATDLPPGAALSRVTYYGLGGVTISKGELTLGVTAPASVQSGTTEQYIVLAYLENRGEGVARDVSLTIDVPNSLRLLNPIKVDIGSLKPGETRQAAWTFTAVGSGTATINVRGHAFESDPVIVERKIKLIAPPKLGLTVLDPPMVKSVTGRYEPYPVAVQAIVSNDGGDVATDTWAELAPGNGIELAPGESSRRYIGKLAPGTEVLVRWSVVSSGGVGSTGFKILTGCNENKVISGSNAIQWPDLPRQIRSVSAPVTERPGWYQVDIDLVNLPEASQLALRVTFDSDTELLAVQRGGFMVQDGKVLSWLREPVMEGNAVLLEATRSTATGKQFENFATVWVRRKSGGNGPLAMQSAVLRLLDPSGKPVPVTAVSENKDQ